MAKSPVTTKEPIMGSSLLAVSGNWYEWLWPLPVVGSFVPNTVSFEIMEAIIKTIGDIACGSLVLWLLVYEFIFSPKARIKRLHRQIRKDFMQILAWKNEGKPEYMLHFYEQRNRARGMYINALLDYHFQYPANEEIAEWVKDNRYELE